MILNHIGHACQTTSSSAWFSNYYSRSFTLLSVNSLSKSRRTQIFKTLSFFQHTPMWFPLLHLSKKIQKRLTDDAFSKINSVCLIQKKIQIFNWHQIIFRFHYQMLWSRTLVWTVLYVPCCRIENTCDNLNGMEANMIIYIMVEMAKAFSLKIYVYLKLLIEA